MSRGNLFVVVAPSGAGKTSLVNALLKLDSNIRLSISYTTRAPRQGEQNGREYHFVDKPAFEAMIAAGDFLEWAVVNGNYYGTPKAPVMAALEGGHDVLFDIDWQGAKQIAEKAPEDSVRLFILPPAWGDLERRLRARAQDSEETMAARLKLGREEIMHWAEYDYIIVNKNFDRAYADLGHIYRAERMKPGRNSWLPGFVAGLLAEDEGGDEPPPAPKPKLRPLVQK